jgi:hypothetical protein
VLAIVTNAAPPVPPVAAIFRAHVVNDDAPEATWLAEVARDLIESYDAPSIQVGVRVVLNGLEVGDDELAGPVMIRSAIDSPVGTADFTLWGWGRWHPLETRATWTRVPIEIWHRQGPPGRTIERLKFAGAVRPGGAQIGADGLVHVQASDAAGAWAEWAVCDELPPYSGLRRGQIVRRWADAAGIVDVDVPPGARLDLPVSIDGTKLMTLLGEFGAPEGWVFHSTPAGALVGWVPRLKVYPEPPDHIWERDDVASLTLSAPTGAHHRVILRSHAAAPLDAGLQTDRSTVEIRGVYAVGTCPARQNSDGTVSASGIASNEARDQVVARIEEEVTRSGGRVVSQESWVSTWYNPVAADREFTSGGPLFRTVYLDEDDEFRAWGGEQFARTSGRRVLYAYDGDELVETREERYELGIIPYALTEIDSSDTIVSYFGNRYLYGAGQSSSRTHYRLLRTSELVTTGVFDPTSGARTAERRQSWGYQATPIADGAHRARYRYGDGSTAAEPVAPWRVVEDTTDQHRLDASRRVRQTDSALRRVAARRNFTGPYEIEGQATDQEIASLRRVGSSAKIYEERGDDGLAVVTISGGTTTVELQSGRAPLPTFQDSVWTRLVLDALEVEHSDATLLAWFGGSKSIGDSPWAQSLGELDRILGTLRASDLSFKASVVRPETLAKIGDTVEIHDPEQRLWTRFLVKQVVAQRDPQTGAASATYDLEHRL